MNPIFLLGLTTMMVTTPNYSQTDISQPLQSYTDSIMIKDVNISLDELYRNLSSNLEEILYDGEAHLDTLKTKDKTFYVIGSEHGSQEAMEIMNEKIKPNVAKNPKEWLFLIEGGEEYVNPPEVMYGYAMGKKLNIPTLNHIVPPLDKQVIDNMVNVKGFDKEALYGSVAYVVLTTKAMGGISKGEVIRYLADQWEIYPKHLGMFIDEINEKLIDSKTAEEEGIRLGYTWRTLVETSNKMSAEKLEEILEQHPDKTHILIYSGKGHTEIIENVAGVR